MLLGTWPDASFGSLPPLVVCIGLGYFCQAQQGGFQALRGHLEVSIMLPETNVFHVARVGFYQTRFPIRDIIAFSLEFGEHCFTRGQLNHPKKDQGGTVRCFLFVSRYLAHFVH